MNPPTPDPVFEVTDWRGRPVRLTRRTLENHKDKRLEYASHIEQVKATIPDPDLVGEAKNGAVSLFRHGLGRGNLANLFLQVVVFYRGSPERGTVATHHFTGSLGDVVIVEHRYQWLAGTRHDVRGIGDRDED